MFNSILKDVKKGFLIINTIYLLCFILGFFLSYYIGNTDNKELIFNQQDIKALSSQYIFWDIFNNNVKLGVKILIGVLLLGISSIASICLNGIFFGIVSGLTIRTYSLGHFLKLVVIHGVMEIIAFNILATAAIIPMIYIKDKILKKDKGILVYVKNYGKLAGVGMILVVVCVFIESFISTLML